MKEGSRNLLVGVFVASSFVVLGVLMTWFGEAPSWLGGSEWELRITDVDELSGVSEGSPVHLSGVEIGRVKHLEFADPARPGLGVVIVAGIKNLYHIPSNVVAHVYGPTLGVGGGHIEIMVTSGTDVPPLDRQAAEIPGEMRSVIGELISKEVVNSVEEMIRNIANLAKAAEPVATNLRELLERRTVEEVGTLGAAAGGMSANLSTVVERLDDLIIHINAVLGDASVQEDLKTVVRDLKTASGDLKETMVLLRSESRRLGENLNDAVDRTQENLGQSFIRLNGVLERLDQSASSLASIFGRIESGDGTLGLLVRDPRLYESAVLTFDGLNILIATVQRIAGKIEEDGYFEVGKGTPVGVLTQKFHVGGDPE